MKQLTKEFLDNLKEIYSAEELKIIKKGFKTEKRLTSFRINTLISQSAEVLDILKVEGITVVENPGIPNSYSLTSIEDSQKIWKLDIVSRGLIYLQGISSQLPVQFFNLKEGDRILDLAAAPGGKTSQMAEKISNTGKIFALENNAIRLDKLRFTLDRQQIKNTESLKIDANKYYETHAGDLFDAILFDAPCSAEGRINITEEKTYNHVTEKNNKKYYYVQREILRNNIKLLKQGGELIYSTCTLSTLENESIVHFVLCNFPELEIVELDTTLFGDLHFKNGLTHYKTTAYKKEVSSSVRILPSEKTEGFFIAKFRKKL